MRIKRASKKHPSTNAEIAAFILAANACADEELPQLLAPILSAGWAWPRTDLQHWIVPLNRFDRILEDVVNDYDLTSMEHAQINAFTPRTRTLLLAILAFEKLLLENSTNRKIFASYDRLNDLLHTTDIEVLLATLRLSLRPAQQYSQTNAGATFGINDQRLLNLAQGWGTREYALEMVDLAGEVVEIPAGLDSVEWQFYKKAAAAGVEKKDKGKDSDQMEVEDDEAPIPSTSATPAPKPRTAFAAGALLATPIPSTPTTAAVSSTPSEGLTTIQLGNVRTSDKSPVDVLVDAIEAHDIPESDRLSLLQKIRIAQSLHSTEQRRTMLVVRLLAIAIFAHTTTETTAQSKLFLYEPELIPQLAELVHPDRAVPIEIQAAAFYALDAIAKFKSKLGEVASALNASVSHGILMYVMRRTVNDLAGENPISTLEFIDSLFNILTYFQTSAFVGNMIVGAGVVSLLVDFVKNQRRDRIPVVTRSIVFLDSLMYGYSSAFTLFGTAGGLAIFVERVKDEIELCVAAHSELAKSAGPHLDSPTGLLSFDQAALLKALLRALQRLMQTAGTTEGLRNLIDSTLLNSVKQVMVHRAIFGPQLFGLAINITATFVHNEPTCLTVIQEAKVPEALYDAIEESIPSSIDVIQAIPNAIGALCLNPVGLAQFNTRPIISRFFSIFSSEKHVKILQDRDNGSLVGAAFDELIRHHPTLKDKVMAATIEALEAIREKGRAYVPEGTGEGYTLQLPVDTEILDGTNPVASSSNAAVEPTPVDAAPADANTPPTPKIEEPKDNQILQCIDVIARFLEGLFQNLAHCKDFVKLEPYDLILDLFSLPCAPSLMPGTASFISLCSAFRIISEVKPTEVIGAALKRVKVSMDDAPPLWMNEFTDKAGTLSIIETSSDRLDEDNKKFRALAAVLTYVALLSDVYANLSYTHGRLASTVLTALCERPADVEILNELGRIFQWGTWEGQLLEKMQSKPVIVDAEKLASAGGAIKETMAPSIHAANIKAMFDVVSSIPIHVIPFFQSVVKLFVHRRSSESAPHRKVSLELAKIVAGIMKSNLDWIETTDLSSTLLYSKVMMKSISTLLFEDRAQGGLQSLLLNTFDTAGGLDAYLNIYTKAQSIASVSLADMDVGAKLELNLTVVHVVSVLQSGLEFLQRLSSHRTIGDAPQTALLVSREKDKTSADYFDPYNLLILIRVKMLPVILTTWRLSWLRRLTPSVVRSVVATLLNILRAEGEIASESSSLGAAQPALAQSFFMGGGAGPLGGGAAAPAQPFVVDETKIVQLIDMGFPRAAAVTALTRYRNNLGVAAEYLLSHPDIVGAARVAEAEALSNAEAEEAVRVVPEVEAPAVVAERDAIAIAMEEGNAEGEAAPVVEEEGAAMDEVAPVPNPAAEDVEMQMQDGLDKIAELSKAVNEQQDLITKNQATFKIMLDEARAAIKPQFLQQALSIAEDFSDIVFDIKKAFSLLGTGEKDGGTSSMKSLIDDLDTRVAEVEMANVEADGARSDRSGVATRLRLVALLAADPIHLTAIESTREKLMAVLFRLATKFLTLNSTDPATRPLWLASAMLVADSLFALAEVPRPTTILAEGTPLPEVEMVSQGPSWHVERSTYFQIAMDVLKTGISTREVFLSTVRLLLVLTRDPTIAASFVERDGLRLLFAPFGTDRPEIEGCRPYAVMILRHVIESKDVLRPMMEREIEAWFAQPRAKLADITAFLRGAGPIAFRHVPAFLEATRSTCKLVQADAPGHYHVALIQDPQPKSKPLDALFDSPLVGENPTAPSNDMQVDEPLKPVTKLGTIGVNPSVETAVHFLMMEVLELTKVAPATPTALAAALVLDPITTALPPATLPMTAATATATKDGKAAEPVDPALNDYFHAAFTMSCLAELVSSYSVCKTSFFNFSSRRSAKESAGATHKIRSSFLVHLLNEVIPVASVVPPSDPEMKRKTQLSQWASLVVVALCYDTEPSTSKDSSLSDLTTIRKVVLDAIAKSFKDAAASTEPTDIRYGRLFALSDLCSRLLTCRPYPNVNKSSDDTSMQLAKLMLEKNFAVILTSALADVDLNFPSVHNLINSILRPLEQLTRVVTKVGRAKPSVPAEGGEVDESSASTFDEGDEQDVDTEEEEAPDLYRNSALGMYEGELEPSHHDDAYMSGSSAEDYDEDDEDMEDMEDGVPGSDISDVSDEEGLMDFDVVEGMSTDDHGDEDDHDSDDDDDDSDEESGDELEIDGDDDDVLVTGSGDEDGENVWGDEGGDMDGQEGLNGDGFEHNAALLRDDDEGETDEDDHTDREEMYLQGELEFDPEMDQELAVAPQGRGSGWDVLGGFGNGDTSRRSRLMDDMMQLNDSAMFGRSRSDPSTSNAAAHPLLVDTPTPGSDSAARRQRGDGSRGTPEYNAWVHSIEQMLGGGAIEQLQQLLSAHGMARIDSPNQIRIQPNTGPEGGLAVVLDPPPQPLAAGARAPPRIPVVAPAARTARQLTERINSTTDFLPVTTVQRWQDEIRICGSSVLLAERVERLVNHVINELHAPARLINQQAKEDEAKAKAAVEAMAPSSPIPTEEAKPSDAAGEPMQEVNAMDDIAQVMELARSLAAGLADSVAAADAAPANIPAHAPTPITPAPVAEVAPAPPIAEASTSTAEAVVVPTPIEEDQEAEPAREERGEAAAEASGSGAAAARVTIEIHGETVDITDTGIDPTFLEALPDDMREEVLNQHFRESRAVAPPQAVPSSINSEFLDALPPDLRAEVLRQEAAEQRRDQAVTRAAAGVGGEGEGGEDDDGAGPNDIDMDPEALFEEFAPQLRQVAGLFGQAGVGGIEAVPRRVAADRVAARLAGAPAIPRPTAPAAKKTAAHREAIQLLDKSGLATLVRLLFFPQPLRKHALQKVLVNLCENSRTRMELINLLLTILHDGTRDVSAVDKSFSQMSLRASKSLGVKETPRRKVGVETPGGALPHFPAESVPNLIAQRCLEALMFLVTSNEQSPLFFLTEQESIVGLNRRSAKKGKGKEKAVSSTTYPIIVLLGLLDRPALLKTQSMMDSLTLLLSAITKSLPVLQKKQPSASDPTSTAQDLAQSLLAPDGPAAPLALTADDLVPPPADAAAEPAADSAKDKETTPSDTILKNPPLLPAAVIRLVVNVLDAGECSSKTFQQTLVLIQNLSYLPEAREVISDELKLRAQALCGRLIPDLDELLAAIQGTEDVRGVTLAKFSPASSLQAQLLRILKTIDWIHSPPKKSATSATDAEDDVVPGETGKLTAEEEKVSSIYESFTPSGLWQQLGSCLAGIESKPELLFIATVLLPLIESLMVVSKYVGSKRSIRDVTSPMSPQPVDPAKADSMESIFLTFTDDHRKILNTMVRNNPGLMSGSFAILVHNKMVLEFDNKRSYFFSRLHDRTQRQRNHYPPLQVNVRRAYVFEDSFHNLQRRSGDEIKYGKLSVRFYNEEGVDAGGVTREWFSSLARQMFNPDYALFQPQAADALTYQPSKSSGINPEHLLFFKFVGRIIGKALYDQRLLEAYFSRSLYKQMLGKPVDHRDLESIDPEYHKSLVWMLENSIEGIIDLTFSVERESFGELTVVDLMENGRNIAVTDENKHLYLKLVAEFRLAIETKSQIAALLQGLYEIVPKDLLQIFSEKELELLISGLPTINTEEWRANTDITGFSSSDPIIGYFWRAVRSFTHEERAKLLQFATGSSRVPLEGFSALQGMSGVTRFSISSAGDTKGLPTAHTCFNVLTLSSSYESYESLRAALMMAINEGADGFGFQ